MDRVATCASLRSPISVTDLRRTQRWYREVLGLEPAGGTNLFVGPLASMVQGVPRSASTCWWLVDRQDLFQFELFEFRSPLVRSLPQDWRPCDIGYTTISFCVADLEQTLSRAAAAGTAPLSEPWARPGARRVCVRDPEGVLIELMEDDPRAAEPRQRPRAGLAAVARSVTLSVPDLERSRQVFAGVLGLEAADGLEPARPRARGALGIGGCKARVAAGVGGRHAGRAGPLHRAEGQVVAAGLPDLGPGPAQHRLRVSPPRRRSRRRTGGAWRRG